MSHLWTPSRRLLLRSAAGGALALPFLHSALPRASWGQEATRPTRVLFYFVPNGIQTEWFTPDALGEGYDLKDIAAPLAPVQAHVSLLSGFANMAAVDAVAGDHARGTGSFLTCVHIRRTTGSDIDNGVSIDQVMANANGQDALFPSLQVGIQPGGNTGDCTAGYSCAYTRNIAWADDTTPLPNITDPLVLFERLFGGDSGLPDELKALRAASRASILDRVQAEATTLHARLGAEDKIKLDQYLTAVREVEVRVSSVGGGACAAGTPPTSTLPYPEHVAAMQDLMLLALQCDLTRVVSFMLGEAASNQSYDFIGVPGSHHEISHHQDDQKKLDQLVQIGNWEVAQFANLVQRMADTPDGEGTLLDSSLVMWSSEISDGNTHSHVDLPVLLAGSGNGAHLPGRHLHYDNDRPIADLLLTIAQGFGVEVTSFGEDGRAPVEDLAG